MKINDIAHTAITDMAEITNIMQYQYHRGHQTHQGHHRNNVHDCHHGYLYFYLCPVGPEQNGIRRGSGSTRCAYYSHKINNLRCEMKVLKEL